MSEYNIQLNKYNALNAGYDQLYPQPMKHANTHAEDGNDPITPSMIGTYNKTEIDTALQNKANATVAEQYNFPLISPYTTPSGLKYSKNELGLVVIQGNLYKADGLSAGTNQIGTMPSGFRPSFQSHSPVYINVGYTTPTVGEFYIKDDNGYAAISVPKAITGEVNISLNACYVAGDY